MPRGLLLRLVRHPALLCFFYAVFSGMIFCHDRARRDDLAVVSFFRETYFRISHLCILPA